ncbi:MAG TPA: beta-ketoacyl-[acyl-carrier-protein] synthase family protein [Acidimicrobiales bacterium]|nr:beta-ketoacyl-[acyl-carrier-protein] synthase family protein [Acidimicrobiales bacterium]
MSPRTAAITGIGVVATCGIGLDAFWEGLATDPGPRSQPLRIDAFDPTTWFGPKEVRRVDRFTQLAVAAATMALDDAGMPRVSSHDEGLDVARCGVMVATGVGGLASYDQELRVLEERGASRVSPFLIPMLMPNAASAAVSLRFGWTGPCETVTTACAAGTHGVANAARWIETGRCDTVLAGASEGHPTPVGMAGFANMTALSPTGRSRPFDLDRDGFVASEGAAMLVLEELDGARGRGAHVYAVIAGSASNADAHHLTAPAEAGAGALACMRLALDDAGLSPDDVAHVNAHGTSTPRNDAAEAAALSALFGRPGPAVTSIKGVIGHSFGAAGALEAAAAALTIDRGAIPPTAGLHNLDPAIELDVVTGGWRTFEPGPVVSNSFAFGGHNGCLVLVPPS